MAWMLPHGKVSMLCHYQCKNAIRKTFSWCVVMVVIVGLFEHFTFVLQFIDNEWLTVFRIRHIGRLFHGVF